MTVAKMDRELIERLNHEDVKAFDDLFYHYHRKLYWFAFSVLKNKEDSREIVQEVFFRIWNNRQKIDSTKSFQSYLFTISHHLIIDQLRLRLKEKEYLKFLSAYFEPDIEKDKEIPDLDLLNFRVTEAVNELPEKRQRIYRLSREQGLSNKDIAQQLGISVKTVENQINLSLKFIKSKLGKPSLLTFLYFFLFV